MVVYYFLDGNGRFKEVLVLTVDVEALVSTIGLFIFGRVVFAFDVESSPRIFSMMVVKSPDRLTEGDFLTSRSLSLDNVSVTFFFAAPVVARFCASVDDLFFLSGATPLS